MRNILVFILVLPSLAFAQYGGGKSVYVVPPDKRAKLERREKAYDQAEKILKAGRLEEALDAFAKVVRMDAEIDRKFGGRTSSVHHLIAEIYVRLNRPEDAIRSYRKCFWWSPERADLHTNGGAQRNTHGLDYALLLVKTGKIEEAKAMYYYALRHYRPDLPASDNDLRLFPRTVVFESDDQMTVWEDSREKVISAIMLLSSTQTADRRKRMEVVREREPASVIPFIYLKARSDDLSWLPMARELARTNDEKEWVAMYDRVVSATSKIERDAAFREVQRELGRIEHERYRNSKVLLKAKEEMATFHKRLVD